MPGIRPPFRADHVGSLLRPKALAEARAQVAGGRMTREALAEIEDREIRGVVAKQEEAGLQGITDGEFRRSWWHLDFLWGLDGFARVLLDQGVAFSGVNTRPEGARVTGKVGFSGHPMIGHYKFLAAQTRRMAKMTIPAPSAAYGRHGRQSVDAGVYPDLDAYFADLGAAYAKAVAAFAAAGCKYLQLDEVYLAMLCDPKNRAQMTARGDDPKRLGEIYADLINQAISDIPADMTVTMHLCRGNFKSTFIGAGAYDEIADLLFGRIKLHGYFMEYDTERAGGFEPLRKVPKDRHVVLGLVTSKSGTIESRDEILRRIDDASKFVGIDQLRLSPQCGFASTEEGNVLSEAEQWKKLRFIVDIAQEVWGKA